MKTLPIITLIAGFILGLLSMMLFSNYQFTTHVKESIYDECFNYYAEAFKEDGISKETIQTCITKSEDWLKEVK